MKILSLMILSMALISCGKSSGDNDEKSVSLTENLVSNCTVERDEELSQVKISCPDGSEEIINDGKDGLDGVNGQDGTSCTIANMSDGAMISCGETQAFIKDGVNGADGSACSVAQDESGSGALISCADGTSAFIKNGQDGSDGKDGLDFVAQVIDPCGQQTTHGLEEVLLKLHSGKILAHFAQGDKQYLTILANNKNYITTDGTGCKFKIDNDGNVID